MENKESYLKRATKCPDGYEVSIEFEPTKIARLICGEVEGVIVQVAIKNGKATLFDCIGGGTTWTITDELPEFITCWIDEENQNELKTFLADNNFCPI